MQEKSTATATDRQMDLLDGDNSKAVTLQMTPVKGVTGYSSIKNPVK